MGTSTLDKSVAITYSASGRLMYPEVRTVIYDDNMIPSNQVTFRTGDGFLLDGTSERWGDYSGIQRVYDFPCPQFWINGTFGSLTNLYHSFVAQSKCGPLELENNVNINDVNLYPIPFQNTFNLDFNSNNKLYVNLRITNTLGDVVQKMRLNLTFGKNHFSFHIPNSQDGLYFVNITDELNNTITKKIIKSE